MAENADAPLTAAPFSHRMAPILTGALAAAAALIAATARGLPLPLDVAVVFLVIGIAATWLARFAPLRGAGFVALVAVVVLAVTYGG